jgi:hypothetical protein
MPGNVHALEAGFEYQWLYGWLRVLDLLGAAGRVESVAIEDPEGGHFDDVTIRPVAGTQHPAEYLQVKFHVAQSAFYTAETIGSLGLLLKAWRTWLKLRDEHDRIELVLVSPWAWDPADVVVLSDRRLPRNFIDGTEADQGAAAVRRAWRTLLGEPEEEDFHAFMRSLRFRLSYPEKTEMIDWVRREMEHAGLRTDDDALRAGADQVRQWVIDRKVRVTRPDLEDAITRLGLRERPEEPSVTLFVHQVRWTPSETGIDYELDWRDAFAGSDHEKGHLPMDPADWNSRLLPDLQAKAEQIERETQARLLRVRGLARLSAWFAVGYTFRETAGWTLETDQYGKRWRTDALPSDDEPIIETEDLPGEARTVALAIGLSGDPAAHVRHHLEAGGNPAGKLVVVRLSREGRDAVRGAGDLARLAGVVKANLQRLVPRAKRVLVFYRGPSSGAVFLGHALNATAGEIQLFEEKDGEYFESFTLK